LEDDVALQLAEVARHSGQPFKTVVNATLRLGLGAGKKELPFRIRAHAGNLRPGIDDRRLNALVFQLDEVKL